MLRWSRSALVAGALILSGFIAVPASASQALPQSPTAHVIGDSVLLAAKAVLIEEGFSVDAVEGRRPTRLASAMKRLPEAEVPLIIHLGSNGPLPSSFCTSVRDKAARDQPVLFVTITAQRPWTAQTNRELIRCARSLGAERASVMPWHAVAQARPEVLASDRVHLSSLGVRAIVDEICSLIKSLPAPGDPSSPKVNHRSCHGESSRAAQDYSVTGR